jgi:hypothetical protein
LFFIFGDPGKIAEFKKANADRLEAKAPKMKIQNNTMSSPQLNLNG